MKLHAAHAYAYAPTHAHTLTCAHAYTHAHAPIHAHKHTRVHAPTHVPLRDVTVKSCRSAEYTNHSGDAGYVPLRDVAVE